MLNILDYLIICSVSRINGNGPAVEGVNVGGAVRRYESRYFSQKIVPAASHHGAVFANHGEGFNCLFSTDLSRAGFTV